jgi:hypothetical protein
MKKKEAILKIVEIFEEMEKEPIGSLNYGDDIVPVKQQILPEREEIWVRLPYDETFDFVVRYTASNKKLIGAGLDPVK